MRTMSLRMTAVSAILTGLPAARRRWSNSLSWRWERAATSAAMQSAAWPAPVRRTLGRTGQHPAPTRQGAR